MSALAPNRDDGLIIAGTRRISQADMAQRAARAASAMASIGIGEGDSVAVILRNDIAFIEVMLGAALIGAYVAPVNWHATADEAAHILHDSGASLVVIHADLMARFELGLPEGIAVRQVATPQEIAQAYKLAAMTPSHDADWDMWCAGFAPYDGPAPAPRSNIVYTSGTTGNPKGVVREPATGAMAQRVRDVVALAYGIAPGRVIRTAITGPMYHSVPNVYALHAVRTAGAMVILQPRFDAEDLLRLIETHRITHLHLVPTMMVRLLRLPEKIRTAYDVSSLRHVVHGAAPCPPEIRQAMIEWFGPVIGEYYGASETGPGIVLTPDEAPDHPGSVGRPTPWTRIEIVGRDGTPCRTGYIGEIFLKIDNYPRFEYRNRPGEADKMRRGDLVSAGDIGFLDAEGYLHLRDRKTDMIISGGVNVYPTDIEAALVDIPGVRDAAVFGLPDPEFSEIVAACVETDLSEQALRDGLEKRLARFKIPRVFRLFDTLPREDSGKIRKKSLRAKILAEREGTAGREST
ncbi:MAG: AMP-binding protein [Rhodobacterales bacterium]